jgi:hypothetical protein
MNAFGSVVETTGYTESFAGNWNLGTSAILTADQIVAPDINKLADKLTFASSPNSKTFRDLSSATDNTNQTFAVWVRTATGTEPFKLRFVKKDGTDAVTAAITATANWQRFSFTTNIAAGGTTPRIEIRNGASGVRDIYIWGASVYKDQSYPYSYRTNETGAEQTQSADNFYWPEAIVTPRLLRGPWAVKFLPYFASGEYSDFRLAHVANGYIKYRTGNTIRAYDSGGVPAVTSSAISHSRYQIIQLDSLNSEGSITISGATSGNGTSTGSVFTWLAGNVFWGLRSNGTEVSNCLITEPIIL